MDRPISMWVTFEGCGQPEPSRWREAHAIERRVTSALELGCVAPPFGCRRSTRVFCVGRAQDRYVGNHAIRLTVRNNQTDASVGVHNRLEGGNDGFNRRK